MKITLVLAFFFHVSFVKSQCYFFETYDYTTRNDNATSIIQTSDGNFVIAGESDEPVGIGDGVYVVKTDECGNLVWKSFNVLSSGSGGEELQAVFENSSDNRLIFFGNMHDFSESKASGFTFKLNAAGDSIYHQIINHGIGISDFCKTALKNNDNEFILGGYYNVVPPNAKAFLSKVDSLGNIIWQQDYGNNTDGLKVKNIDKTQDSGYVIGGWENYGPQGTTQNLYLLK